MTMIEFLDSFGIPYKFKGDEAVFELCPFCKHEHSKNRFLVNTKTGAYICNRQNSCGVKGNFKWDSLPKTKEKKEQKEYVTLRMADFNQDFTQEMLDYMAGRGISKETLINSKIFNRNGRFCFFYVGEDEAGTCIGVKYRTIDKKISAAKGSIMNLLNWRLVPKDAKELYITEGEIDMLSLLEIGIKNVVSVPNGAGSHDWIDYHYEWLEKFKKIILIMDNDEAGKKGMKAIYDRLKHSEIEIKKINLLFYKDPNEILMDESGRMKLKKILETGEEDIMEPKMMDISDVHCDTDDEYYSWGDDAFNRMSGGMRPGEVIIFTGNPGSGKSTFVNNLMANLVEQGIKVFTMQGEFRKEVFKTNICKILSRPGQIETFKHPLKDKLYGKISYEQEKKINAWLKGKITIHTEQTPSKADLIETMEQAYKKNGVKVFVIDNLMTINIDSADKYEAQKNLFIELQEFVKKYNVCLMIVAHPKKNIVKALDEVDDFIISGASEIVNLANAVVFLKRLSEDEVKKLQEQGFEASVGAILTKDRKYGDIRSKGFWNYEIKTGRFLDIKNPEKTKYKEYGWEKLEKKRLIVEMDNLPFLNEG